MSERADARKFMMEQVRKAAAGGDPISAGLLALESEANLTPYGAFVAGTMQDEYEDESDILDYDIF